MKLGPVTKLHKKNKKNAKKIDDDIISANCDITIIFLIHGELGANQKSNSRHTVCKTYLFINSTLSSYKNCKQN